MGTILAATGESVEATLAAMPSWRQAMKRAFRSSQALREHLGLEPSDCVEAEADFPVFAPREYVERMEYGNAADPLLLQVLAQPQEMEPNPAGQSDPVGDALAELVPGLLQKYDRRVLLITTGACAVHCRYCFRRHFPYGDSPTGRTGWSAAIQAIRDDHSLDEVILSGGDPLTVNDENLSWLVQELNEIAHIRRIRVHTRVPVVIPQRICESLLDWVKQSRASMYFVLHFNHAREIDAKVAAALQSLSYAGATLLNQAVLLRGVNDSLGALKELCLSLVDHRVLPYYLHQLDYVAGAMHFEVADRQAIELIQQLRRQLPGYAVPQLVREVAGESSKTPIIH